MFSTRYKLAEKTRILARIVYIEECQVPYNPTTTTTTTGGGIAVVGNHHPTTTTSSSTTANPYHLPPGSVYYECYAEAVSVNKMP